MAVRFQPRWRTASTTKAMPKSVTYQRPTNVPTTSAPMGPSPLRTEARPAPNRRSSAPSSAAREPEDPLGDDVAVHLGGAAGDRHGSRRGQPIDPRTAERTHAEHLEGDLGEQLAGVRPGDLDDA